jgi:hypothetical protein
MPADASKQLKAEKVKLGDSEAPEGIEAPLGAKVEWAVDEAFMLGYPVTILVATALATHKSARFVRRS